MRKEQLEENQILIYAVVLILGISFGFWSPNISFFNINLEYLISPVLGILLYSMFAQIPYHQLYETFANKQFFSIALLTVNFLIVPSVVWLLSLFLPEHPPLLLGLYLVLLTPCIDYVVVFTHLGHGDAKLILTSTPLLLLVQMLFLPLYLWLFMGEQATEVMKAEPFIDAFLFLIALPLLMAFLTEFWAKRHQSGTVWLQMTSWFPVPFMALTLFLVVASQIGRIDEFLSVVIIVVPIFIIFMALMPFIAKLVANSFCLDAQASRALIFSAGTRNSLVVLPLALALPNEWMLTSVVIVTQTLVELVGELVYIRYVPSIIPDEYKIL